MAAFRTTRRYHCRTSHTSLRISFGAGSPGLDIVELELYQVAVGISHVKGFSHPSGAYDVLRGTFDLHARFLEAFGQCIRVRTFDHQGEVIVTSGGDSLEGGIRPQMQDEPRRYPQRDEGMLSAFVLVEAERLETQDVVIEAQRPLDILYPPIGVVSIGYLHRSRKSFRSESYKAGHRISVVQVTSSVLPTVARDSMAAWASAARSRGNRCPITGRNRPAAASAKASSVKARVSSGASRDRPINSTPRPAAASSDILAHSPLAIPKRTIRPPRSSSLKADSPTSPPTPSKTTSTAPTASLTRSAQPGSR